ncbi:unnamed protein product [Calypogeia fissa]
MTSQAKPAEEMKRVVKATLYFVKRPDISDEEFHRYWSEDHGPLISGTKFFKERILKYNQYHNDLAARNKATSMGFPVMEYDGATELWAEDLDTLLDVSKDEEYLQKIVPDAGKFISREYTKFMFGYDDLKMDKTK